MELIKAANADEAVLSIRAMEAMERVADGRATKIIIPSDMQDMAGLIQGVKTVWDTPEPEGELSPVEELAAHQKDKSSVPNASLNLDR